MSSDHDVTVFGLSTCDTCRKARRALESAGLTVRLRDVRDDPLTGPERARFLAAFGPALVNRASTTWRGLDEAARQGRPEDLVAAYPALMKRPVIARGDGLWLGWGDEVQAAVMK